MVAAKDKPTPTNISPTSEEKRDGENSPKSNLKKNKQLWTSFKLATHSTPAASSRGTPERSGEKCAYVYPQVEKS